MTISESRNRLRNRYIKWYTNPAITPIDKEQMIHDAKYSWWEREKSCQEWCDKEKTYVPMSETKTFKIMRGWVKHIELGGN
tara:strand:- start:2328 stop:2570 length:243 start_codon:yes stop_codon:yes gene_type:complete